MASKMFLYWGSGSPPCWRVMIALEEKGLQGYQQKLVSFDKKEQKSDEILKINPRGEVPTFRDGDIVVNDSLAIIQYLERAYSGQGTKLYPEDKAELAVVLQKQYEALNLAQKGYEVMFYEWCTRTKIKDENPTELAKHKAALAEEVQIWENNLTTGAYVAGPKFSMADVVFYPQVAYLVRLGAQLSTKYPTLATYYELVTKRPSVQATWPPHWKDSSGNDLLHDL